MRLFVALEIPAAVRDNLATLIKDLRNLDPKSRWVRPENLHATLKFIGEAPPGKLDAMRSALGGVRAERAVAMDFRVLGFFPYDIHPRGLCVNVMPSSHLQSLAADIAHAIAHLGLLRDL